MTSSELAGNAHSMLLGLVILAGFVFAGCVHLAWMRSAVSQRFAGPIDLGLCFRGRRVFGPNKTWRGFMAVIPASALGFYLLALVIPWLSASPERWLWPVSPAEHAFIGAVGGLGLMLGELPNSFIKRQLDIAAGEGAQLPTLHRLFSVIDRFDSPIGALLALSLVAPMPAATWLTALLLGPVVHAAFSAGLYGLGVKQRAA